MVTDAVHHHRRGDALTASELYALLRLRVDVFVVEQECPYPELDDRDLLASTRHLWIEQGGSLVACARVCEESAGMMRIGRVCTALSTRRTGLGARLMQAALLLSSSAEHVLHAQTHVQGFYERFGFVAEGEPFDEDGIPHIVMRRP